MHAVPYAKETLVILLGYALGCFTSGYYLVRWWTGDDLRLLGSGSVGATNVGRVLGAPGFFLTVLCDFCKGLLAAWLAQYFRLNPTGAVLTMIAVTLGHVWPVQLWFHGGKGVATSLGAVLMFDYAIGALFAGLFLVLFAAIRNFVLAGMFAFAITPLALLLLDFPRNRPNLGQSDGNMPSFFDRRHSCNPLRPKANKLFRTWRSVTVSARTP